MLGSLTYCEKCMRELHEYGGIAVLTFEKIAEEYINEGPFDLSDDPSEKPYSCLTVIKFLEQKGYIVSTESSENSIQIKPSCILTDVEGLEISYYFCKCKLQI